MALIPYGRGRRDRGVNGEAGGRGRGLPGQGCAGTCLPRGVWRRGLCMMAGVHTRKGRRLGSACGTQGTAERVWASQRLQRHLELHRCVSFHPCSRSPLRSPSAHAPSASAPIPFRTTTPRRGPVAALRDGVRHRQEGRLAGGGRAQGVSRGLRAGAGRGQQALPVSGTRGAPAGERQRGNGAWSSGGEGGRRRKPFRCARRRGETEGEGPEGGRGMWMTGQGAGGEGRGNVGYRCRCGLTRPLALPPIGATRQLCPIATHTCTRMWCAHLFVVVLATCCGRRSCWTGPRTRHTTPTPIPTLHLHPNTHPSCQYTRSSRDSANLVRLADLLDEAKQRCAETLRERRAESGEEVGRRGEGGQGGGGEGVGRWFGKQRAMGWQTSPQRSLPKSTKQ